MPVWLPALVLLAPGAPGFEELCLTGPEGAAVGPLGGRTLACLAYGDPYEYGLPFELPFLVLPDLGARPCYAIVDPAWAGLLCRALWSLVGAEHKVLVGQVSVLNSYFPDVLDPDLPEVMGAGLAAGEDLLATRAQKKKNLAATKNQSKLKRPYHASCSNIIAPAATYWLM